MQPTLAAVSEAMNGGDAVISVLGARGPVMAEATRAIVDAAEHEGTERVVMLSSFAVARDRLNSRHQGRNRHSNG